MTGEYRLTMDPSEKDALLMVPNAGLSWMEQTGLVSKLGRFNRTDGTRLPHAFGVTPARMNEFERLALNAKVNRPPAVKFRDLEASVNSPIKFNFLPMQARVDFFPLTESSVLTNITVQLENKDLQFQAKDRVQKAVVNMYGRITTLTRRVATVFEDTVVVDSPAGLLGEIGKRSSIHQKSVPLAPGPYRLNLVLKDAVGGAMNNYELALNVPRFESGKLASSSLVLADLIEKVPTSNIGAGPFVVGGSKVRPRLSGTFRRGEKMGIYLKVCNFTPDDKTNKPSGSIEYEIVKNATKERVLDFTEDMASLPGASAQQVTIEKLLPLADLTLGPYRLMLKVTDRIGSQTLTPTADFTVR